MSQVPKDPLDQQDHRDLRVKEENRERQARGDLQDNQEVLVCTYKTLHRP